MDLGVSFSPFSQPQGPGQGQSGSAQGNEPPVQQAIRVLSLRLPQILGARALAPGPLLAGPGSAGLPSMPGTAQQPNLGLDELLRRIFGGFGQNSLGNEATAPVMAPSLPSTIPHVTPGVGEGFQRGPDLPDAGSTPISGGFGASTLGPSSIAPFPNASLETLGLNKWR